MKRLLLVLWFLCNATGTRAQGETSPLYRCPGGIYSNALTPKQAHDSGCRPLDGAPVTVVVPKRGVAVAGGSGASTQPRSSYRPSTAIPKRRGSSGCEADHWVQSVMSDGAYVKLEDGSIWQIDAIDQIDTILWLPTTDVVACPDKLINTEDNETVGAIRIR
jgi:hypothetical protein